MIISYYLIAAEGGGESNPPPITLTKESIIFYLMSPGITTGFPQIRAFSI